MFALNECRTDTEFLNKEFSKENNQNNLCYSFKPSFTSTAKGHERDNTNRLLVYPITPHSLVQKGKVVPWRHNNTTVHDHTLGDEAADLAIV